MPTFSGEPGKAEVGAEGSGAERLPLPTPRCAHPAARRSERYARPIQTPHLTPDLDACLAEIDARLAEIQEDLGAGADEGGTVDELGAAVSSLCRSDL